MKVLKFEGTSLSGNVDWGLDDTLIPFWHVVVPPHDYTACGQATAEYLYAEKEGVITCPHCIRLIKFCKEIKSKDLLKKQDKMKIPNMPEI
jgi:hypothetical protein